MRVLILGIIIFLSHFSLFSQDDDNPVVWKHETKQLSDTEYELIITGKIHDGWHVYSQYTDEGGSLPSEFTLMMALELFMN